MNGPMKALYEIFVHNLPWTVGNKELLLYFSKFGHVSSASVVYDKSTGMSRGYGFISFSNRDGCLSAVNENNHTLDGRVLNVEPAGSKK